MTEGGVRFWQGLNGAAAVVTMDDVINFLDLTFGLMAIPTMLGSLLLAPRVMAAAREYFDSLR